MKQRKTGNPLLAVGYLRVSTDEQNLGEAAQREQITRWAAGRGITVCAWFNDHGVSGSTQVADRPALLDALACLRDQGAGVLVVAKRDRIARDVMVAAMAQRMVKDVGAELLSAAGEGEGDSPEAKLMRTLVDALAEWERATIAARTRAAMAQLKAQGKRVGGIPYGMRVDPATKMLVDDKDELFTIEAAKGLRAEGMGISQIGSTLAFAGSFPRQGKHWSHRQIAKMLEV